MMELEEPPRTYIALRGDFRARGLEVEPDVPAFTAAAAEERARNRLGLARGWCRRKIR